MHSHSTKNKTIFHFNSDGSGDVSIVVPKEGATDGYDKNSFDEIQVPFEDVIEFMAHFVRYEKINELEEMDDKDVLGIPR